MPAAATRRSAMRQTLPWLIATNAATVSTLYWTQSLVLRAAAEFGPSPLVKLMPGASLAGYALGVALLAAVARDLTSARGLVQHAGVLTAGLCLLAVAPDPGTAAFASLVIGFGCSLTQRLLASATSAVPQERRPQTIGWIIAAGLCGIVLARALVPIASTWLGWRAMFWSDAGLIVLLGSGAALAVEQGKSLSGSGSSRLPRASALWREETTLRRAALEQAVVFAAFNLGWAFYPRLLAASGTRAALPMGLVAGAGAAAAVVAGRVCSRWEPGEVARTGLVVALGSILYLVLAVQIGHAYSPAMALLDTSTQVALVANQARAQALASSPAMRGRVAAMITTVGFAGGAVGAALGNLIA